MRIDQFEHILRACQGITDEKSFFVIGTAALLVQHPELAEGVVTSHEVDAWPLSGNPKVAELLESIGEMSPFHEQFGIYVDPYPPSNAVIPEGWEARTKRFESPATSGARGYCLEKHDLIVAKLARGEPKDLKFTIELLKRELLDHQTIEERIQAVDPSTPHYQNTRESPLADIRQRILQNWEAAMESAQPTTTGNQSRAVSKKANPEHGGNLGNLA